MSGYLHALWIGGLQEHKYNKVNTRSMKSSSSLESLTKSVYQTDQTRKPVTSTLIIRKRKTNNNSKMYKSKRNLLYFRDTDFATGWHCYIIRRVVCTSECVCFCACSYMCVSVSSSSHYLGSLQVRAQQAIWTGDPHPAAHYSPHRKLRLRAPDVHG